MSHTVDRLSKVMKNLEELCRRKATSEVVLVWNAEKSQISEAKNGTDASRIWEWHLDPSHPFRIFLSFERGLKNDLLNRYHPSIEPKEEAIVYFVGDGPFFSELAMSEVGLELWRRNSDAQVGCFPRNVRFMSDRMKEHQIANTAGSIKRVAGGLGFGFNEDVLRQNNAAGGRGQAAAAQAAPATPPPPPLPEVSFTPTCRTRSRDTEVVEYNYHNFPSHAAHMLLPSGSILHRNYLCFVWHPAFESLRRYVRTHPTHCDDQTISALVSHLSGRAPRVFPRRVHPDKTKENGPAGGGGNGGGEEGEKKKKKKRRRRRLLLEDYDAYIDDGSSDPGDVHPDAHSEQQSPRQRRTDRAHRRLLWQHKDWGTLREESINSVSGYFGSINPGSVGWCAGDSRYEIVHRRTRREECKPEFPERGMIPWVVEGGTGHDVC
eukprot:CAMPEP_0113587600 /NCGR_PEP_ID=MMETSP0015_2-20120614/35002_1 /TAXON_ID=2838 /ORGANISM="Odontella" /LENGTH=433 /DNA_ID=CAMNT_0000493285 /DNA_START=38 /DNA_END=1339 /DNA_ORIENTATION=- /assembly_acc=CAM_ASM_000160